MPSFANMMGLLLVPLLANGIVPIDSEIVAAGSSVAQLNESVVFYAAFDDGVAAADLATGRGEPLRVRGTVRFVPGRFGQALVLGGGTSGSTLTYSAKDHLDFRRPGAVSFWVSPVAWQATGSQRRDYVRFLAVLPAQGSFVIERMGFDRKLRRPDRLIVGAFDLPGTKRQYIEIDGTLGWKRGDWHLIVLNWDAHGFEVSLDGSPFERRASPSGFEAEAFVDEKGPLPFVVGSAGAETTAIDDFTLYRHPLAQADVARLYAAASGPGRR